MFIKRVSAKRILDSRGKYTIEVSVNGCHASSPSGTSTGGYETPSYHISLGWNIKAIRSIRFKEEIKSFDDLSKVEKYLCERFKLKDPKQFGGNALFALESAILKALAKSQKKPLWQIINSRAHKMPIPLGNAIGGGLHSHFPSSPEFQEFLLIPRGRTFEENLSLMRDVYFVLGKMLGSETVDEEGAWQTSLPSERVLKVLSNFKGKVNIGVDIAANSFYKKGVYIYKDKSLSPDKQADFVNYLIKRYRIFYLEDPFNEGDFKSFSKVIQRKCLIAGDDLTVTHLSRLKEAIRNKSVNSIIIKPNQNGSLLEVRDIIKFCKSHNLQTIMSHRAGETLDDAISDYAFAFQVDYVKYGIATKWREAKLKRLVEIEASLP